MRVRDFRIGWRLLLQEPGYSAVVVLSLSIGFAACFLLFGYVASSFAFDAHIPDSGNIYVLKQRFNVDERPKWFEFMPLPFVEAARKSGLVEGATPVVKLPVQTRVDINVQRVMLRAVDPEFASIFSVVPLQGDLHSALTHPDEIALTKGAAQRVFAGKPAFGNTLDIEGVLYKVSAILPEPPETTTLPYEALVGLNTAEMDSDWRAQILQDWSSAYGKVYVKLKPGASAQDLSAALQEAANNSPFTAQIAPEKLQKLGQKNVTDIRLVKLRDAYFDPDFAYNITSTNADTRHGDRNAVLGLAAVAILILLLASTNYVNLATVRAVRRQREIGIHKLHGASSKRIVGQFLAESILVAGIATALGLLIALAFSPAFFDMVNRRIDNLFSPEAVGATLLLGAMAGTAAGIYPAWVALRVRAAAVLAGRGNSENLGGQWLRRALTVVQFAVAITLTGATMAIAWQTSYATNADPGFDVDSLVVVELPNYLDRPNSVSFRDALSTVPGITGVSAASTPVGFGQSGQGSELLQNGGSGITTMERGVSANFLQLLGIKALSGRVFDPQLDAEMHTDIVVINATAARALGYKSPQEAVGRSVTLRARGADDKGVSIIGVVADIRHQSMREPPSPMLYRLSLQTRFLMLHTSVGLDAVQPAIETLWRQYFPNDVLIINRARSLIARNYAEDSRMGKLLVASTLVAIGIASFGIYVLSAYSVQRRRREIVLRKLHGATRVSIAKLMGKEFGLLIAIGALVGLPLAAVFADRYLSDFAERAPIGQWNLVAALGIAAVVALVSVIRHVRVAMKISPRQALNG